jgi:hypothetical protein
VGGVADRDRDETGGPGFAVAFLVAQAGLTVAWWAGLAGSTAFRGWFELDPGNRSVLDAFAAPDLLLIVGSLLAAHAVARRRPWAVTAAWVLAGGLAFETVYIANLLLRGGHGWVALPPMGATTLATVWVARMQRAVA